MLQAFLFSLSLPSSSHCQWDLISLLKEPRIVTTLNLINSFLDTDRSTRFNPMLLSLLFCVGRKQKRRRKKQRANVRNKSTLSVPCCSLYVYDTVYYPVFILFFTTSILILPFYYTQQTRSALQLFYPTYSSCQKLFLTINN